MGTYHSKNETDKDLDDFQTVEDSESQLINQVHRKMEVLKELKSYFENGDQTSVYHKHMIGTIEYYGEKENPIRTYILCSNMFFTLYEWPIQYYSESYNELLDY